MKIEFRPFRGDWDWGYCRLHTTILRVEDTCGIMAIDADTNTTVGACLADSFTKTTAQCHIIVTNPLVLRHGMLETACDWAFNDRGLKAVYGWVPGDNLKAIKLNKHMGWQVKATFEDGYAEGVDLILMECTRANCRFIDQNIEKVA